MELPRIENGGIDLCQRGNFMPAEALDNAVEHLTLTENHEYVVCACQKRMGIFIVEWSRNRHEENSAGAIATRI